jgi:hypothetical protein
VRSSGLFGTSDVTWPARPATLAVAGMAATMVTTATILAARAARMSDLSFARPRMGSDLDFLPPVRE